MDVKGMLIEIFRELKIDPSGVETDSRLRQDLDIDSTEMVEIAVVIEKRLSIGVDTDEFLRLRTFGDVVNYVASARVAH
jgi:acyl carrier protein